MTAAQQALQRLQTDTGASPQRSVRIYIYGTTAQLQGALLFAQEWTGGVTFRDFDVICIGVAPSQLDWGEGAVAHELTHWIVGQVTYNDYGAGLPVWLDEGLARYNEGAMTQADQALLNRAASNGSLISVRSLSSPFSAITDEAYLSYAESSSIVGFLIQTYGKGKMLQLLDVFRQGSGYDEALQQVYGFDQDGLDARWRQSLGVEVVSVTQIGFSVAAPLVWPVVCLA
ncbi:MAG: peptidase MA family metallohydrolase [Chloroflexi bacterium]|nr:peptidase MA family metallohydrolase [Chloroflexota bacterium]